MLLQRLLGPALHCMSRAAAAVAASSTGAVAAPGGGGGGGGTAWTRLGPVYNAALSRHLRLFEIALQPLGNSSAAAAAAAVDATASYHAPFSCSSGSGSSLTAGQHPSPGLREAAALAWSNAVGGVFVSAGWPHLQALLVRGGAAGPFLAPLCRCLTPLLLQLTDTAGAGHGGGARLLQQQLQQQHMQQQQHHQHYQNLHQQPHHGPGCAGTEAFVSSVLVALAAAVGRPGARCVHEPLAALLEAAAVPSQNGGCSSGGSSSSGGGGSSSGEGGAAGRARLNAAAAVMRLVRWLLCDGVGLPLLAAMDLQQHEHHLQHPQHPQHHREQPQGGARTSMGGSGCGSGVTHGGAGAGAGTGRSPMGGGGAMAGCDAGGVGAGAGTGVGVAAALAAEWRSADRDPDTAECLLRLATAAARYGLASGALSLSLRVSGGAASAAASSGGGGGGGGPAADSDLTVHRLYQGWCTGADVGGSAGGRGGGGGAVAYGGGGGGGGGSISVQLFPEPDAAAVAAAALRLAAACSGCEHKAVAAAALGCTCAVLETACALPPPQQQQQQLLQQQLQPGQRHLCGVVLQQGAVVAGGLLGES